MFSDFPINFFVLNNKLRYILEILFYHYLLYIYIIVAMTSVIIFQELEMIYYAIVVTF